jgi:hypothetical protein
MNIPDWSSRRGLGTCAFTVMVRPGSCTTGSTKSTRPENSRPGSAATRKVTTCPTFSLSAYRSGTWKTARCGETVWSVISPVSVVT